MIVQNIYSADDIIKNSNDKFLIRRLNQYLSEHQKDLMAYEMHLFAEIYKKLVRSYNENTGEDLEFLWFFDNEFAITTDIKEWYQDRRRLIVLGRDSLDYICTYSLESGEISIEAYNDK